MNWDTERKLINTGFVLALLILLLLSFFTFRLFRNNVENDKWVKHTHHVLENSKELLSNLKDAETGQRGFIITADEDFLEPFYMALERNNNLISNLKALTSDNQSQQKRIAEAGRLIEDKFNYSKEVIRIRREEGLSKAVTMVSEAQGKLVMDKLREIFSQIEQEERRLLSEREAQAARSQKITERILLVGLLASIGILLLTYFVLHRQIRIRARREEELQESREWFSKTLHSIGDAVVATDNDFKITFMNPMAEKLTGWGQEDAKGKSVDVIYHAVHAVTREIEEVPVIAAISRKHIVSPDLLPVLISKEGKEIYIDTCGAPIINSQDVVIGSVLIFRDMTDQKAVSDRLKSYNTELEDKILLNVNEKNKYEHRLKIILDNMLEGAQILDPEWRYMYVNNEIAVQSRCRKEELIGSTLLKQFPGVEHTEMFRVLQRCMEDRVARVFEHEFVYPDKSTGWFKLLIQPIPEGLFILSIDINERKKAEQERKDYIKVLEDMLHMTSHKVRQPVSQIMGISNMLDSPLESQEDLKKVTEYMKAAVESLDHFTREFTEFLYNLRQKSDN